MATASLMAAGPRSRWRTVAILVGGVVLGALLTALATWLLPESPAREVFLLGVSASLGPLTVDLRVLEFTVGPVAVHVNVFTVLGILLVSLFARRLL